MSTVIIIGGGGSNHAAITRAIAAWPSMTADEQAAAVALLDRHREELAALKCQGVAIGEG